MADTSTIIRFCVFVTVIGSVLLELQESLKQCCESGKHWGSGGFDCYTGPRYLVGVPESDLELCQTTEQLCCEEANKETQCKKGVNAFKTDKNCPAKNDTESSDIKRKCCEICRLGRKFGESKSPCSTIKLNMGDDLMKIAQDCCKEVNPPPNNTKPTPKNKDESNQDPDYENYDDYGIPTPALDNLCDLLPGQLCQQICIPTPGSYYCKCNDGFVLMEDQKTCQQEKIKPKPQQPNKPQIIVPNPEKPVPLNRFRTMKRQKTNSTIQKESCEEYNPCQQQCSDVEYGIKCSCLPGYEIDVDRKSCKDINECLDNIHVCDPEMEVCINEIGGYNCLPREEKPKTTIPTTTEKLTTTPSTTTTTTTTTTTRTTSELPKTPKPTAASCPAGYRSNYTTDNCVDVDECDYENNPEVCDANQQCINTPGSYECRCKLGFQKDPVTKRCVDINECQTKYHTCLSTQRCDNTVGSYQCIRFTGCGTGYTLNAENGLCEDDDECALGTDNCRSLGSNYHCRNTLGSFRCEKRKCYPGEKDCINGKQCQIGYHEDENGNCVDTDECRLGTHNCNAFSEICINRIGGFECRKLIQCPNGYESTATGCEDINECATNKHTCKGFATCHNFKGGYRCVCPRGYQPDENNSCQDINECNLFVCPFNSDCQNAPGSYQCICKNGFRNVDANVCEDIDECALSPGICQHNCINVFGSYRCTCKSGFKLHENNRSCTDLDECEMFKDQKLCIGECVNTPGSYACRCPPGYVIGSDGRTCQDVDECIKQPCKGQDEVCLNTRGSFRCNAIKCPPGYVKDAEHKNRCKVPTPYCLENDMNCLKRPVTYSYNFITFVSMLPIPPSGHLDLFTMRGPLWSGSQFTLDLLSSRVPPHLVPATKEYFRLQTSGWNQAVIALIRPIPGPQELELQLTMNLYRNGMFSGVVVAKLFIYVSEYEF